MGLRFFNASSGKIEDFLPGAPPRIVCSIEQDGKDPRFVLFRAVLPTALAYLGYALIEGEGPAELFCGFSAPPRGARLWLRPAPSSGGAVPGLLCLKTHYRKPLALDARSLEEAQGDLSFLRQAARRLERDFGSASANPSGVAGYKKRFRDALSSDLDLPEALASLWDALRPGALSPGSQLAVLREARSAFGPALPLE